MLMCAFATWLLHCACSALSPRGLGEVEMNPFNCFTTLVEGGEVNWAFSR